MALTSLTDALLAGEDAPRGTLDQAAMDSFQKAAGRAVDVLSHALRGLFPKGFHAKFQVVVDNGVVNPGNITVEWRPRQASQSLPRSKAV